jgi:hypothetical protein
MEPEGSWLDLSDQIHHTGSFLFLAGSCLWQAVAQVRMRGSVIPPNKVCSGGLERRLSGQARLLPMALLVAVVLLRREPKAAALETPGVSVNKVWFMDLCSYFFLRICLLRLVVGVWSMMVDLLSWCGG